VAQALDRYKNLRLSWAIVSAFIVESVLFGTAMLPAVFLFEWHRSWDLEPRWLRIWILAIAAIPTYAVFAIAFMALSAWTIKLLGWRPTPNGEWPIKGFSWPLLDWGRYSISIHLVRIFAGTFVRTTPLWTWYMRLNGAKLGSGVFINSLDVTDHCLLDFGNDVVIGAGVHLSGHTVEKGVVKTAPVQLGNGVTIGVSANIEIGVRAGDGAQVGALSMVPKYEVLEPHTTYVGIPAEKLERSHASPRAHEPARGSAT